MYENRCFGFYLLRFLNDLCGFAPSNHVHNSVWGALDYEKWSLELLSTKYLEHYLN